MKHKAVITIEMDPSETDICDISIIMEPPCSATQDNFAAGVALRMVELMGSATLKEKAA